MNLDDMVLKEVIVDISESRDVSCDDYVLFEGTSFLPITASTLNEVELNTGKMFKLLDPYRALLRMTEDVEENQRAPFIHNILHCQNYTDGDMVISVGQDSLVIYKNGAPLSEPPVVLDLRKAYLAYELLNEYYS